MGVIWLRFGLWDGFLDFDGLGGSPVRLWDFGGLGGSPVRLWDCGGSEFWWFRLLNLKVAMVDGFGIGCEYVGD